MGIVAAACLLSSCSVRWRAPRCAIRANPFAFDQQLSNQRPAAIDVAQSSSFSYSEILSCLFNGLLSHLFKGVQPAPSRKSFVHRAGANGPIPDDALSLASHPRNGLPARRIVTAANRHAQQRSQRNSSEKRHPAGRVMVCLTRARLHTTMRGWQRAVAARWWCVGRGTAPAATRVTCATRTSSVS